MIGGGASFTTNTDVPDGSVSQSMDEELNLEGLSGTAPIDPSHIDDVFIDDNDLKPPATNQSHRLGMRRNGFDVRCMAEAIRGATSEHEMMRCPINNIQNPRLSMVPPSLAATDTSFLPNAATSAASFTASDFNCYEPMRSHQQLQPSVDGDDNTNRKSSRAFASPGRDADNTRVVSSYGSQSAVPSWYPRDLVPVAAQQRQQQLRYGPQFDLRQHHQQHNQRQQLHSAHDVYNSHDNQDEPLPLDWLLAASFAPNSGASTNASISISNASSMNSRFKQGMGAPPHSANVTLSFANASSMYPRFNNDVGTRGPQPHEMGNVRPVQFDNNYFHAPLSSQPQRQPPPADVSVAADVAAYLRHRSADDVSNEDESSSHLFLPSAEKNTSTTTPSKPPCRKRREKNTNDNDPNAPVKALTAYNFFFRFERDRLLEFSRSESSIDDPDDLPEEYFAYHAWTPSNSLSEQHEMLENQWRRDRSVKRNHTKTHGRISFASLTRRIAVSWKALPQPVKDVFRERCARNFPAEDWFRQRYGYGVSC